MYKIIDKHFSVTKLSVVKIVLNKTDSNILLNTKDVNKLNKPIISFISNSNTPILLNTYKLNKIFITLMNVYRNYEVKIQPLENIKILYLSLTNNKDVIDIIEYFEKNWLLGKPDDYRIDIPIKSIINNDEIIAIDATKINEFNHRFKILSLLYIKFNFTPFIVEDGQLTIERNDYKIDNIFSYKKIYRYIINMLKKQSKLNKENRHVC